MSETTQFYRCRVTEDLAAGSLVVGRRRLQVQVDEKSIDGFTVRMEPDELARVTMKHQVWVLEHCGERAAVRPEWFLNHVSGNVQMGLRRMGDLTPPPRMPGGFEVLFAPQALLRRLGSCTELWLGVAAVLLLMLLALPGLGDHIGTAPRIRQGSEVLRQAFDGFFRGLFADYAATGNRKRSALSDRGVNDAGRVSTG